MEMCINAYVKVIETDVHKIVFDKGIQVDTIRDYLQAVPE